jgi:predicted permease
MKLAWRIYRRLAQAFPHEFKVAYGAELQQLGADVVEEIAKRQGLLGLFRFLADVAIRVPIEYLSEMRIDLRHGWRGLRKSPGFALVGTLSIGLGIGFTTSVYSFELRSIFRALPGAANASRLVMLEKPVSYYYVEQYREQKKLFSGVAAFRSGVPFNATFQSEQNSKPERITGQLVSPDYFSVLGVQPQLGRLLDAALDKPGDAPTVVISDRFWRNRLNAAASAVGQTLRLNGKNATIVGITPKDFIGLLSDAPAELFVPITVPASLAPELANDVLHQRNAREFQSILCLAPGVTIDFAEVALDAVTRHLDEQDLLLPLRNDKGRRVSLLSAGNIDPLPRNLRPVIIAFFVLLMGLIVTIACMNLANMLLARGANRRKELAIRLAVGASRFRLVRQMMTEGILLSLLGGVPGFALAYSLAVVESQFNTPMTAPAAPDFTPDWHTAVLVLALAIVCGIGFSVAPALRATKTDVTPALKEGLTLQLPGFRRFGLRNLMMVVQVAGSLMLLLITGFLSLGITKVGAVQTKFDAKGMILLSVDPIRDGYSPEKAQSFFETLPKRLQNLGSVRGVVLVAQPPFSIPRATTELTAEGSAGSSRVQKPLAKETIGAGYFAALSEPLVAGREFEEADQHASSGNTAALPAILNESAARGLFGDKVPLGRRLRDERQSYEVVGVVRDLKIGIGTRQSVLYLPLTASDFVQPPAGGMAVMVRADAAADALASVRAEIASLDPKLTIFNVSTLGDYLYLSRAELRFAVRTYGGIGIFGLVLAAIGLAGVTAYEVAQRSKEIGIRTALGATKGQVLRLVLREGAAMVTIGTVLGLAAAFALAKVLSAITDVLVEALSVGTNDPRLVVGAPMLMAALALLACYIPARRAAKIDPLKALRQE